MMRRIFSIAVLLLISLCLYAQTQNEVTLVVSGQGSTKEDATANALRSAIEQAYGVFVSANTQILNDEVVKDEIATVASGNVKSYEELSCVTMADGSMSVTLSATVSISNLITYAKSHGSSAEFAGQTFAMNVKMRKLNTINESKALANLCDQVFELARDIYDYKVEVDGEPKVCDNGYEVKVSITSVANGNYMKLMNLIKSTLQSLSLSGSEYDIWSANNMKANLVLWDNTVFILRSNIFVLQSIFFEIIKYFTAAESSWILKMNPGDNYCCLGAPLRFNSSIYDITPDMVKYVSFTSIPYDGDDGIAWVVSLPNYEPNQPIENISSLVESPKCTKVSDPYVMLSDKGFSIDIPEYDVYNNQRVIVGHKYYDISLIAKPKLQQTYEVSIYLSEQELLSMTGFDVDLYPFMYDMRAKYELSEVERQFKLGTGASQKYGLYDIVEFDNLGVWTLNDNGVAELSCSYNQYGSFKYTADWFLQKEEGKVNLISVDGTYCCENNSFRTDTLMRGKVLFDIYLKKY